MVMQLAAVLATAAEPVHDHSAMGHDHAAAPQAALGSTPYTTSDLVFLSHMIVHHRQALELCEWVPSHSGREEFQRFARYLHDAQQNEISMMQGLLDQAASRGATIPPQHLEGDPPMDGMLSRAQMATIAAASGDDFERLWLEGMIKHHRGGVAMAMTQQVNQHVNGNQPWGVDVLVDDMLTVQRAEIARMEKWSHEWRNHP
jgi:uncharacterized protein (DUF305 family)